MAYLPASSSAPPVAAPAARDRGLLYQSVYHEIREQILRGQLPVRAQVPTEAQLCEQFEVSRITVQRALSQLVDDGFLVRRRGSGTYVKIQRDSVQKKSVGLLALPVGEHGIYGGVIDAAKRCATSRGYQVSQVYLSESKPDCIQAAMQLNASKAVGALYFPIAGQSSDDINHNTVEILAKAGQKVVVVDSEFAGLEELGLSCVVSENLRGAYDLTKYLVDRGMRRIAFLRGPHIRSGDLRHEGFRRAMADAGLEVRPEHDLLVAARSVEEQGLQEAEVLAALRQPPEAILCVHDLVALNVLRRCTAIGWRVPADVSIAGFDDLYPARISTPPLTTVRQDVEEIGRLAMSILLDEIEGREPAPSVHHVPCELVVRDSTL